MIMSKLNESFAACLSIFFDLSLSDRSEQIMQASRRQPEIIAESARIMSLSEGGVRAHKAPTPGVEPPEENDPIPPEVPQPDPAPQQDPIPHQNPV
jgi:hypothetical protein